MLALAVVTALAFFARTAVFWKREPGGVDAWYYLGYARAFRKKPGLRVRLPEYLLQDEEQSYAPVFPSLLGCLPEALLKRTYWAISPAIDCLTLILLHALALRLTHSPEAALIAAAAYAVSPAMVSETRALTPRSLSVLLQAVSLLLLLQGADTRDAVSIAAAVASAAVLFLSSATGLAAYFFVAAVFLITRTDLIYLMLGIAGLVAAWVLSLGHLGRVFANYVHAVRFRIRNRRSFGSHPILDSPLYGGPREPWTAGARELGFLGGGLGPQIVRLIGEHPLVVALVLVPPSKDPLYIWAASLAALAVAGTLAWPLRAFGPGRNYMKSAIFPTVLVVADAVAKAGGLRSLIGSATVVALAASVASVAFFVVYMRRKKDELTAHVPPGLSALAARFEALPPGGVVCLPGGYSDYIAYRTKRPVLWGSHSGSLDKFELVSPVWRERVEIAARRLAVRYLIVERAYVDPSVLALDAGCAAVAHEDGFDLFDLQASSAAP